MWSDVDYRMDMVSEHARAELQTTFCLFKRREAHDKLLRCSQLHARQQSEGLSAASMHVSRHWVVL